MGSDLGDLLPLFLSEGRDRLERLAADLPSVGADEEAGQRVRRELHALKGASRMMRLTEFSELCHEGENLLGDSSADVARDLLGIVDRLFVMLGDLESDPAQGPAGPGVARQAGSRVPARGERSTTSGERVTGIAREVRVPAERLDQLADRATRLRVLAIGAGGVIERLASLEKLAERAVGERDPRQAMAALAATLRHLSLELEGGQRRLTRLADRQLELLLSLQLQPLGPFLKALGRHARELARSLGKDIRVEVEPSGAELDRRILGALEEAFVHLVRNAVDHGIESPEAREAAGKPAQGVVFLRAVSSGGEVGLTVGDDGAGIDTDAVLRKAVEKGILSEPEAAALAPSEAQQVVFRPGFTTADEVSQVSGRGVGMDAVAAAVHRFGGTVAIESTAGRGTSVHLRVPLARRGERVVITSSAGELAAVPESAVVRFTSLKGADVQASSGRNIAAYEDRMVPFHRLADLLGLEEGGPEPEVLVELSAGGRLVAIAVDRIVGDQEVLIRPIPEALGSLPIFDGVTLLASGRPVPVLSPLLLTSSKGRGPSPGRTPGGRRRTRVLVVDDSMVTRQMIRRLLEDAGCTVTASGTAEEALEVLDQHSFDCLVTDIEMPGLSGLDLTRRLRATPALEHLPIVVVSTRNSSEDRLAGMRAGADAYITKQSLDARELVLTVHRLGGAQ